MTLTEEISYKWRMGFQIHDGLIFGLYYNSYLNIDIKNTPSCTFPSLCTWIFKYHFCKLQTYSVISILQTQAIVSKRARWYPWSLEKFWVVSPTNFRLICLIRNSISIQTHIAKSPIL